MFLSDNEYKRALALIDGAIEPEPPLTELTEWVSDTFGITIYDYICDTTSAGLNRLRLVVWDESGRNALMDGMNYDRKKQRIIGEKFAELAKKHHLPRQYRSADGFFVCCDTVSDQIIGKALAAARDEICALEGGDVVRICIFFASVHIFYQTDAQIAQHAEDGQSELLRRRIIDTARKHDRFDLLEKGLSFVFTSQQTLDEKYGGKLFFYWR